MIQICPKCGMPYDTAPALSRKDNTTKICPNCGTWEALEQTEIEMEEKIGILSEVYKPLKDRSRVQFPKADMVKLVRDIYPVGCRVRLIYMKDRQAPPIGTFGTVTGVDDVATMHVRWDNGSSLGIAYGEDYCRIVCCRKDVDKAFKEMCGWRFDTYEEMEIWFRNRLEDVLPHLSIKGCEGVNEEIKNGLTKVDYSTDGTFGENIFGMQDADFAIDYILDNKNWMYVTKVRWN